MKNKAKFVIILLILFFNVVLYIIPSSYKKKYSVSSYKIVEQYIRKEKLYIFEITNGDDVFKFNIYGNYNQKKKLIKDIKKIDLNNGYCLLINSKKIDFYPLCIEDNEHKSFYLVDDLKGKISSKYYKSIENESNNYKSLKINYLNDKKYLIWNYNYFYYLAKKNKKIDLFENDYYQLKLASQVNNYLFVPNYDDGYTFNDAYVINFKNGKKESWKLKYDISIDSRIIGTHKKSIYLLDKKNRVLYEIVPHKKKIRKVTGRILEGNKFKKYSVDTIINNNLSFNPQKYFNYDIINSNLYLSNGSYKVLLNQNVSSIVYQDKDSVYYLIDDTLYMFNPYYGNVKLITNYEWKFNSENMIFIY